LLRGTELYSLLAEMIRRLGDRRFGARWTVKAPDFARKS